MANTGELLKIAAELLDANWASDDIDDYITISRVAIVKQAANDQERRRQMAIRLRKAWDEQSAASVGEGVQAVEGFSDRDLFDRLEAQSFEVSLKSGRLIKASDARQLIRDALASGRMRGRSAAQPASTGIGEGVPCPGPDKCSDQGCPAHYAPPASAVDGFKARLLAALEQDRNRYYSITTSSTASDSMVSDAAVSCAAIEGIIKRIERGEFDSPTS